MNSMNLLQNAMEFEVDDNGLNSTREVHIQSGMDHPRLTWRGKSDFTPNRLPPSRLKEIHGDDVDGWRNKIYWGDNLHVMIHLLREFRGKVDAIYIDPPFDSRVDYSKKISTKSVKSTNKSNDFNEKQYTDVWSEEEYLQFIFDRLTLFRELMADHGVIMVHVDWRKTHHIRCLLDEVFGSGNFLNEIIWKYDGPGSPSKQRFGSKHDSILRYCKDETSLSYRIKSFRKTKIEGAYVMYGDVFIPEATAKFERDDEGRFFYTLPRGDYTDQSIERLRELGRIKQMGNGGSRIKYFVKKVEGGFIKREKLQDVWTDISSLGLAANSIENTRYPTQKPERLLERLIASSSAPNDLILDCFMGSGTTPVVCQKLDRRFIGSDINLGAIQTASSRLILAAENFELDLINTKHCAGFEIFSVNQYNFFRNPVQANAFLMEKLKIKKCSSNAAFDGEKDGRAVKIMPVNRIAIRDDLNELISKFDYQLWNRRKSDHPNQPVEKILLICMGHEKGIVEHLKKSVGDYTIDVEVMDVLQDGEILKSLDDFDVEVVIKDGELLVKHFYPGNLLERLSPREESISDWRELTESIFVDWNYDGSIFRPDITDIAGTNALVSGRYKVPDNAETVRVKIIDLISDSWEGTIING